MAFMTPSIWKGNFWILEDDRGDTVIIEDIEKPEMDGDECVKEDLYFFDEYMPRGECVKAQRVSGWGCQLSAPGYMDQTDISLFDSEDECIAHMVDFYEVTCDGESIDWDAMPRGLSKSEVFFYPNREQEESHD